MPPYWHEEGAAAGDILLKTKSIMTNYQGKRSGTNNGGYAALRGGGKKLGLIKKTENLGGKHVHYTGLHFIKTSVIQQTPSVRKLERRCEQPNLDVKTELDYENIKLEPDTEDYTPTSTSSNLPNEVSVIVSEPASHLPFLDFQKAMLSGPFSTRPKIQNQIFQEAQSLLETNSLEELLNSF